MGDSPAGHGSGKAYFVDEKAITISPNNRLEDEQNANFTVKTTKDLELSKLAGDLRSPI